MVSIRGRQNMDMPTRNSYVLRQEGRATRTMSGHVKSLYNLRCSVLWDTKLHESGNRMEAIISIAGLSKAVISPRTKCELPRKYRLQSINQ